MIKALVLTVSALIFSSNLYAEGSNAAVFCDCEKVTDAKSNIIMTGGIYFMDFSTIATGNLDSKLRIVLLKKIAEFYRDQYLDGVDVFRRCSKELAEYAPCKFLKR